MSEEENKTNIPNTNNTTHIRNSISRFNALKHGILSKKALLINEDPQVFAKFARKMMQGLKPQGPLEVLLAERLITTAWRLRRLLDVERAVMEYEQEERQDSDWIYEKGQEHGQKYIAREMVINDHVEKIIRYETMLERSFYRTLKEFRQIQADRGANKPTQVMDVRAILGE